MSTDKHKIWSEKYRPTTLVEYVFHDDSLKNSTTKMVNDKSIPHLLLSGCAGSGKTTLSMVLINELNIDPMDVLTINASDENDVETMRTKIKSFISTYSMGPFKVVRLEEADYITLNGQAVLRSMMQDYADVARFILTCNYENKIIPALKSRVQHYRFTKPDRDAVLEYAATVLIQERVKFTADLLDKYTSVGYPDIRKVINLLQQNTHDGRLQPLQSAGESGDYKFKLLELIETGSWVEARQLACAEVAREEWEDVFRFMYENLEKSPTFSNTEKWEAGIVILADHLYRHSLVADPEINFAACMIRLGQL